MLEFVPPIDLEKSNRRFLGLEEDSQTNTGRSTEIRRRFLYQSAGTSSAPQLTTSTRTAQISPLLTIFPNSGILLRILLQPK